MPERLNYTRLDLKLVSMPSLSDLPSNINIKKLTKALVCLGFVLSEKGGKGSHIKLTYRITQKSITIPNSLNKNKYVLYYLLKEINDYSGITWEQIKEKL